MITKTLLTTAVSLLAVSASFAEAKEQPKMTPEMQKKLQEMIAKQMQKPQLPPMSLEEAKLYFSYNIGVNLGTQLKSDKMILSAEVLKGLQNALDGKADVKTIDSAKMQQAQGVMQAAQQEEAKKEGMAFLEENKKKEGVQVTKSGLQYKVIKSGEGVSPVATDKVKVHYTGKLIDGTVFDSSVERGQPVTFPVNGVIAGWTEGLQLMKPGAKFELTIPQEIGYGERGAGAKIPGFSTLLFEVELLEVIKPVAPKAEKSSEKK